MVPVVALCGWLCPGAGYLLIGQRVRALVVGLTILAMFFAGLVIGGMKVVAEPDWNHKGGVPDAVFQTPWFIPQVLAGPVTIIYARIGWSGGMDKSPYKLSHSRSNEIGTLYTAVAGMLNLLAIIDATYRAGRAREETP